MLLAFLNPHLERTERLVDYAVRKKMDCIGFVYATGTIHQVNLAARAYLMRKTQSGLLRHKRETATQVCALYERLDVAFRLHDYRRRRGRVSPHRCTVLKCEKK